MESSIEYGAYGNALTFELLNGKSRRVWDALPDKLRLRMRRALSWIERAEKEKDDYDAAFIFYWIAFNAAYATNRRQDPDTVERANFSEYFDAILGLDADGTIYDAIYERFSGPIRILLDNQYVFQPFWDHHSGLGHDNWEFQFSERRKEALKALLDQDTRFILSAVFDRLYVPAQPADSRRRDMERFGEPGPGAGRSQDNGIPGPSVHRPDDGQPGSRLGSPLLPRGGLTACSLRLSP